MQSLLVVYDDPSAIYQPGSRVSGSVEIVTEKKLKIEAIKLEIYGEGRSYFTQSEQKWRFDKKGKRESYKESHTYDEHITYIDETLLLWTPANGSKFLTEGNQSIPFSFVLPVKCAPSYEGTFGHIRYHCKAKLDVPWGFDKKSKSAFTVIPVYNLLLNPQASCSASAEATENIGFSVFKHGYVTFKASIPKRGYAIGEPLTVTVWISNGSSRVIQKVGLRLKQLSTYTAYSQSSGKKAETDETRTVFALDKDISLQSHQTNTFQITTIVPVMPPTFSDCPIISVNYELHIKIFTKGNLKNTMKVFLPIIIGSLPSQSAQKSVSVSQSPNSLKQDNIPLRLSPTVVPSTAVPAYHDNLSSTEIRCSAIPTAPPLPSTPSEELPMLAAEPPPPYDQCVLGTTILPTESSMLPSSKIAYKC